MFNQDKKLRPIPAVAAAVAGAGDASATARGSQDIVDARQESQIWTTFALNPYLRTNDITVSVHDGKATLTGAVADVVCKDLAKQIALGVNGIRVVDNSIEVPANYVTPAPSEKRSFGELIKDVTTSAAVKSKLLWSRFGDGLSANVDTKGGWVYLAGTAVSPEAKEFAGKVAANTRGVRSVDNQLMIQTEMPGVTTTAGAEIADGWITTKVKATFMYSTNVDSSDISVSTQDGVVKLDGKVGSGGRRSLAIELASNVRGVKSVDASALMM